jgi:hypothetical protein
MDGQFFPPIPFHFFDHAPGKMVCPEKVAVKLSKNEIVKNSISASDLPLSRQGHRKLARHSVLGSCPRLKSVLKGRWKNTRAFHRRSATRFIFHILRGRCPRLISDAAPRLFEEISHAMAIIFRAFRLVRG